MASAVLPGPVARLARDRLSALAVVLLASLATLAAGTTETATTRLTESVDANWRGTYDILVRPGGSRLDLEQTNGLVEPNFLGFSGQGGIDFDELDAIRRLPDVEVAAPVSMVGYLSYTPSAPALCVSPLPDAPAVYHLEITAVTSDGQTEIVIGHNSGKVFFGPYLSTGSGFAAWASQFGGMSGGSDQAGNSEGVINLGYLKPIASPLMAVDPKAEQQLLGPGASFLDRFEIISDRADLTNLTFDLDWVPPEFDLSAWVDLTGGDRPERPVVPILVSKRLYAQLRIRVQVDRIGEPLSDYSAIPREAHAGDKIAAAEAVAGQKITPIGDTELDLTSDLRPFLPPPATLIWPGSSPPEGYCLGSYETSTPSLRDIRIASRPEYEPKQPRAGGDDLTFQITPRGPVGPDGAPARSTSSTGPGGSESAVGIEESYRTFRSLTLATALDFRPVTADDQPFRLGPIGTFDLADLETAVNPLTYVPLGAYDPPETTLVADGTGTPLPEPVSLTPTLNPAGLIAVPPLAITDLEGARLLRGDAPIDAIRVRVAGLTGYDEAGTTRVERVASAIASLGLDVDIVAGASPQDVEVFVPAYHVNSEPAADLGYVRQAWTTLGAAERVEHGLGDVNVTLLVLALLTATVYAAGLQLTRTAARTEEVAILSAIGWSRRRILRWLVGEGIVGGALVLTIGLASWLLFRGSPGGLLGVVLLALVLPALGGVGALGAWRRAAGRSIERGDVLDAPLLARATPVVGAFTFGLRSAVARPARSAATIAAAAIGSAALGVGGMIVAQALNRAGPTRLALALTDVLRPYQFGLLAVMAAGGLLVTIVLLQIDQRDRRGEFRALVASGWPRARIGRSLLGQQVAIALPAALVAALLAAIAARPMIGAVELMAGSLAALAAVCNIAIAGRIARSSLPDPTSEPMS